MTDESDDHMLASNMIEGHGAVTVARRIARSAALAGKVVHAKSRLRVLAIIQRKAATKLKKSQI